MRFASATPYSPTFMYRALVSGRADVISAFSSDGRVAADRLRVLADPKRAIPGYDAILLVAPGRANDARFTAALRPLIGAIGVEAMREVIVASGAVDAVEAEIARLADASRLALKSTAGLADEPLDVLDALIDFSTARSA